MSKMARINLSLREDTHDGLKAVSSTRGVTVTHLLRQLSMALVESSITGEKKCITGEHCILGYMPSMQDKAKINPPR